MIVLVNYTKDDYSHRLLNDLQGSGLTISLNPLDPFDVWLNLLTPTALRSMDWQHIRELERPVINILLASVKVPDQLPGLVLDLSTDYAAGYDGLIQQLQTIAANRKLNPYRGILPYSEVEAPQFCGRSAFTKTVHDHITNGGRFVALVGGSGSGKTSFIHAGLVARLRKATDPWLPITLTLDAEPLRQLAACLQPFTSSKDDLVSRLYSSPMALGDALAEVGAAHGKLLLSLDSFEHVFTRVSLTDRVYFLDALYDAIKRDAGHYLICFALRADFENRLLEYPKWNDLLRGNSFALPPLKPEEIAKIVTAPAQDVGLSVNNELRDRLGDDAARFRNGGSLLPMSFVLEKLAARGQMTLDGYEGLGTINEAVGQYAENVYSSLSPIQQNIARQILLHAVDVTEDNTLTTRPVGRKRMGFTWANEDDIETTLASLLNARLIRRDIDFETNEAFIQPGHESLLHAWPRYQQWVSEDTENLRYGSHLERLAATWNAREYSEHTLLRGTTLDEAVSWTQNPDHLPSPLLQNYVAVSSEIRQSYEEQQKARSVRQWRANVALIGAFVVALLVMAAGSYFLIQTVNERDTVSTLQADTQSELATATAQNEALAAALDAAATTQSESENQIATSVAQYNQVSTAQAEAGHDMATAVAQAEDEQATLAAQAEVDRANAAATIQALNTRQAVAATAFADVPNLQSTLEASIRTQQLLTEYMAEQLAHASSELMSTQPTLALRLAAEAAARLIQVQAEGSNPMIGRVMRDAVRANASFSFGDGIAQSWFLNGNNYAVIDYAEKPDELWTLNPPEVVAEFENPVEQIIPVANGKLFLVDYANEAPDELWRTEEQAVAAQLNGDIASPPAETDNIKIPNVVQLDNNTYFVVKYAGGEPSELWENAGAKRIAALDGDIEAITPLKDGYFFARYVNGGQPGGIWQTSSGQMLQPATNVITTNYDNGIFALRRDHQFDEIWRTNPFDRVTRVIGRVDTVTNLRGSPYFIVQYAGDAPAEIWQDGGDPHMVYKFRGSINNSLTFLGGLYFFIRYDDQSASELWSTNPLEVAARLNGHLANGGFIPILGEEAVIIDYEDNAVSEVWSLKDHARIAQLNGNVKKVLPILGDVFFVAQYEEEQPAEIWSAVDAKLIAPVGDRQQLVTSVTPLKGGSFLLVMYAEAPAELWEVGVDSITRVTVLPDVVTEVYPFETGSYFVVNFRNTPAQIWQTGVQTPLVSLQANANQVAYNLNSRRLGLSTADQHNYVMDFERLAQVSDENSSSSDADLLALVCEQLSENAPVADEVVETYLGGLPSVACIPDPSTG